MDRTIEDAFVGSLISSVVYNDGLSDLLPISSEQAMS